MQSSWQQLREYSRAFRHHWLQYLILFGGTDLVIQLVVIPIFRLVTTLVLQAGEVPFVSYMNVVTIITKHPLVIACLVIELLVLLLVVYAQFGVLLLGVWEINQGTFSIKRLLVQLRSTFAQLRWSSLVVLLGYFVLILPFADLVFRTPLLSKVQVPEFILDYLTRNIWLLGGLVCFYVVVIGLALRYLLALPLMVYRHQRPRIALKTSWRLTRRKKWWPYLRTILMLVVLVALVTGVFYMIMIALQAGLDHLPKSIAYLLAIVNLTVIETGSEVLAVWSGVVAIMVVTPGEIKITFSDQQRSWSPRLLVTGLAILGLVIATTVGINALYLAGTGRHPMTISHRGVAEENGVQNTIAAMKKTHRLHPDYIEMDLHETKDHQFVVLHDDNLKKLTGVNKRPAQLTLRQITQLTARENGYQAKIASFDDYLATAERLHQKLLVEIKPTPDDSKQMLVNFTRRYGKRLIRDHDRVHSLDYTVVEQLKKLQPRLYVMYVQPYNFTYPNVAANGYSMEYSTLTNDFIIQAHLQHKQVFAWTVNRPNVMKQMMYDNVDGIITDNLNELNTAIRQYEGQQSYASRLLNFIMVIPAPFSTSFEP